MMLSPVFGYLGDRFNRTVLMTIGIIGWSGITLASSFVGRQVIIMITYLFIHLFYVSKISGCNIRFHSTF